MGINSFHVITCNGLPAAALHYVTDVKEIILWSIVMLVQY